MGSAALGRKRGAFMGEQQCEGRRLSRSLHRLLESLTETVSAPVHVELSWDTTERDAAASYQKANTSGKTGVRGCEHRACARKQIQGPRQCPAAL